MKQLLILAIYILAAAGLGYLAYWGAGQVGLPNIMQLVVGGIIFGVVLIFGLQKTGVSDV
jgi:hypothetical protein